MPGLDLAFAADEDKPIYSFEINESIIADPILFNNEFAFVKNMQKYSEIS